MISFHWQTSNLSFRVSFLSSAPFSTPICLAQLQLSSNSWTSEVRNLSSSLIAPTPLWRICTCPRAFKIWFATICWGPRVIWTIRKSWKSFWASFHPVSSAKSRSVFSWMQFNIIRYLPREPRSPSFWFKRFVHSFLCQKLSSAWKTTHQIKFTSLLRANVMWHYKTIWNKKELFENWIKVNCSVKSHSFSPAYERPLWNPRTIPL